MAEDRSSLIWRLRSVAVNNIAVPTPSAHLLLDRANSEFGVIHYTQPGVAVLATYSDNDEPICFAMKETCSACSRFNGSCKKVCVQMQGFQLDFEFVLSDDASEFVKQMGILATKVHNTHFEFYEASSVAALSRVDFNMEKQGYPQAQQQWMATPAVNTSEWSSIYKSGKCSDFTIVAGNRKFPVHRVLLSTRSQYFNAVCDGKFMESEARLIHLPEPEHVVAVLLDEMYEVYNPTTGSIFTNFAGKISIDKEQIMNDLVVLFIASDKYNLEGIKRKVADAIIDRMPFLHDPLSIVDLAACIYGEQCPQSDNGLRASAVTHVQARMPSILQDADAWTEYVNNKELLYAYHQLQCESLPGAKRPAMPSTPPTTPTSADKRKRTRT